MVYNETHHYVIVMYSHNLICSSLFEHNFVFLLLQCCSVEDRRENTNTYTRCRGSWYVIVPGKIQKDLFSLLVITCAMACSLDEIN
jgi:hypothetical protein